MSNLMRDYLEQRDRDLEKRISELEEENRRLRRERDDAVRAAWAVRDLATPPISDADVERCIEEAKRVRQEIESVITPSVSLHPEQP